MPTGPHGQQYEAHRPVVYGRRGMVSSGHSLASQAGISILQRGGNAADAALAVAAALNVVEPNMSGVGGDGFIMHYQRASGRVEVVNATGPAPLAATLAQYASGGIPMKGIRSVSVPGLVSGWFTAHGRFGRLSALECLAPAIGLADNGFPTSYKLAAGLKEDSELRSIASSAEIFAPTGKPLQPGEVLRQRDLGNTLRQLATEGPDYFYAGPIAKAIVACSETHGGLLTLADFARFKATWVDPISVDYRGWQVFEAPPNSSGHVLLQELNLVEQFNLRELGCNTAEAIHIMVEAKKLAFADRERYMADPDWVDVPIMGLLSKEYARERARLIHPDHAAKDVAAGDPWKYQGGVGRAASPRKRGQVTEDTTCFAVVDGEGNAVCQLQSLQSGFGSSLVAAGTGVLLNNRMTYWHLDPDHVDCLEPGKRVRHTMNPVMAFDQGKLMLVFGTPGADTQVQTNLQVLTHVLEFGMTVAEAVEAPRWRHMQNHTESTVPHTCEDALTIEQRVNPEVIAELSRLGHAVQPLGPWEGTGSEVMIQVNTETGTLAGAADPRRDGYAIGL